MSLSVFCPFFPFLILTHCRQLTTAAVCTYTSQNGRPLSTPSCLPERFFLDSSSRRGVLSFPPGGRGERKSAKKIGVGFESISKEQATLFFLSPVVRKSTMDKRDGAVGFWWCTIDSLLCTVLSWFFFSIEERFFLLLRAMDISFLFLRSKREGCSLSPVCTFVPRRKK